MIQPRQEPIEISSSLGSLIEAPSATALFCHASYEDRCLDALSFNLTAPLLKEVFIIKTTGHKIGSKYYNNYLKLKEHFEHQSNMTVYPLDAERNEPVGLIRNIDGIVRALSHESMRNIIVDITTFPRERMLCLLDYLKKVKPESNLHIVYTEPEMYASESGDEGWLTQGVRKIAPVPGFNGRQNPNKGTLLIVLSGHEAERAHITIRNMEPDKIVILGQGKQQYKNGVNKFTDSVINKIQRDYPEKILSLRNISSRDYLGAQNSIHEIADKYGAEYNIYVSIHGTKLQVLGVMLECQRNRKIQITYAHPQLYNINDYSRGIGRSWFVSL